MATLWQQRRGDITLLLAHQEYAEIVANCVAGAVVIAYQLGRYDDDER